MEELKFEIGSKRSPIKISFTEYKNQRLFDIRKYFANPNKPDEFIPTKKGISLSEPLFKTLIDILNLNSENISKFYNSKEKQEINSEIINTIGREFTIIYENGTTTLKIDPSLYNKFSAQELLLFKLLVDSFYKSLIDVIEDSTEIELILDGLNRRIKKQL